MAGNIPELPWINTARTFIGVKEIKGIKHSPTILGWLKYLNSFYLNDETPWCGTFVANVLKQNQLEIPKHWYRALDYLNLPVALQQPAYGCLVIFSRQGGGHVGFVVGKDKYGNLMVLGGNQKDQVSIAPFSTDRVVGYRWPAVYPTKQRFDLPTLTSDGRVSTNEA